KREYAENNRTYERKGWMACEQPDGTIDADCQKREEAKGEQGVPREQLLFSSLMENFDAFATKETFKTETPALREKQAKTAAKPEPPMEMEPQTEQCNYLPEKIYAALFFFTLGALIFTLFFRRRR
ncbi:hypothetical protein JXA05_03295, partial [Candidatus Peregrinibacteria bacterium]|nr:hypothetical protein [Candidatus Peregrinibacteria bacterium]